MTKDTVCDEGVYHHREQCSIILWTSGTIFLRWCMLTATKVERDQIRVAHFQNRLRMYTVYTIHGFEPTRVEIAKPTQTSRRAQIFLLRPGTRKSPFTRQRKTSKSPQNICGSLPKRCSANVSPDRSLANSTRAGGSGVQRTRVVFVKKSASDARCVTWLTDWRYANAAPANARAPVVSEVVQRC